MWAILTNILPLTIAYTAPLIIIAMGGLFSERSGTVNIALEGLFGMGAFVTALVIFKMGAGIGTGSVYIAILIGALAGGVFSLLHAFACVTMKADQVVSGTAINILSAALTVYLARSFTGSANIDLVRGLFKGQVPILNKIPVLGPLFFTNAYSSTFVVLLIVAISWYVLYYRPFGLRLRACGENPQAADSLGINVFFMRYVGVFISGFLAGLGGGIVVVTYSGQFSPLIYNGLGFLALAALIFGKWTPIGVIGASFFFGFAKTVADMSKLFDSLKSMPNIFFNVFPYVITLVALVIFSKNAAGPKALGEPYDAGKR